MYDAGAIYAGENNKIARKKKPDIIHISFCYQDVGTM